MKSNKQNQGEIAWSVEAFESRLLMDGDVSALLSGGDLVIRGDAQDNQIVITQLAAGTIRIAGLEQTTVNGKPSVDVQNFSGDLLVQMQQRGDDNVAIMGPLNVPHDLRARLSAGELVIEGSSGLVNIGNNLNVQTGRDGHLTIRNEVKTGGGTSIDAGGDVNFVGARATLPDFASAKFDNSLKINNPYFPVVPGTIYTYHTEGVDDETGQAKTQDNTVEVLANTRTIQGVKVREVRDRVFEGGLLIEDTFDWYAQDNNGNVWYFGEAVTDFQYDDTGKLIGTNHDGSWEAGQGGSKAGIIMEANPRLGYRYFQEFSPNNVMDHGEGLAKGETARVPAGKFTNVFRTEEASVMEPFSLADKLYAPGIGTITEFELDLEDNEVIETVRLVSVTLNGKPVTQLVPTKGFKGVNSSGRFIGGAEIGGEAAIAAKGPVVINGGKFHGDTSVNSGAELIVVDSILRDDASFATNDTLSLKGISADGTIRATANPDDVFIFDSHISRFVGRFGAGDNSLAVKHSVFDVLDADGGAGRNTFHDLGDNVFGKLILRRFVKA